MCVELYYKLILINKLIKYNRFLAFERKKSSNVIIIVLFIYIFLFVIIIIF